MADKTSDPVALWQQMIGEMEKRFNAFATAGGVTAGAQRQFGDVMERYLLGMNLPSRAQMVGMAERLASIEVQLCEIKTMLQQMNAGAAAQSAMAAAPRPPRTKRPPQPSSGDEP
jgi:hypothetical protein